jgi:hypothetical protein
MKNKTQVLWLALAIISIFGIVCSAAVLFPQVQKIIIHMAEEYLIHRKVNFYDDWMMTLSAWARGCITLILMVDFFALIPAGRKLFTAAALNMKTCLREADLKRLVKPALLLFGLSALGMVSVIRANFSYVDDIDRAATGYHGWNGWSRHLSDILSTFIHADPILTDISPLPQILGLLFSAVAAVICVCALGDAPQGKKISIPTLLAGLSIIISPYFLENLSYKFDAPYMGLSLLFSVLPFLFTPSRRAFVFSSVASICLMCITYQASSGIYVLMVIASCFRDWNYRHKTGKEIAVFAGLGAFSFCAAMLIFRFCFMVAGSTGHGVSTVMLPAGAFISGVWKNLQTYVKTINSDFSAIWKFLIVAVCLCFIAHSVKNTKRRRPLSLLVCLGVLALSFALSYGAYLFLESPLFSSRALYGFCVFIALTGIGAVSGNSKPAFVCVLTLNWCFFAFAFSYGNALTDQKRWNNFRVELVLRDLNQLFPDNTKDTRIAFQNEIGFGPIVENIARHAPLIKRLVPHSNHYHVFHYLIDYYHFGTWEKTSRSLTTNDLPVILDTYYHTIKSDGENILVVFK